MKRVLIVSPHFPPSNAADMHRVRMVLPFLRDNGWEAEVLAVEAGAVAAPRDTWLEGGLPDHVPVHRVNALGLAWSCIPGLGTLGWRAFPAILRYGEKLLYKKRFDLVYFSTTQWPVHLAGPRWLKRFGVPFAMDYQDPWVNDYYVQHPEVDPPGGRLKYAMSESLSRWCEPRVLRHCSGFTSVSAEYPKQIVARYPWASSIRSLILPFPGSQRDFERAQQGWASQDIFDPSDGREHWVYVGRGGKDLEQAAKGLFGALRIMLSEDADLRHTVRVHFVGTSYAPPERAVPSIVPLSGDFGLEEVVDEKPGRIPYSDTLACLQKASALIVLCSDDPSYTASKIYPYLLARKPLLVVCHEASGVKALLDEVGGGVCVPFGSDTSAEELVRNIITQWWHAGKHRELVPLHELIFKQYKDEESTVRLCRWWEHVLEKASPASMTTLS